MIITRIRLENWKNFSQADVKCGSRVFVIGPNASGKSNFLDALRFLRDVAKDGLYKAVESRGGLSLIRYINARNQPNITISVTLDDLWEYTLTFGSKVRSQAGRSQARGNTPRVIEESVLKHNGEQWEIVFERPNSDDANDPARLTQTALQQINANKDFREVADFISSIRYRHILPQLVREPKLFLPAPVINDPFGRDLVLDIWKTSGKTRDSKLKQINEALKVAVPNFNNLKVEQDENGTPHIKVNYSHWRRNGAWQNEELFSDGTLRLLAVLWSLLGTKGPLLLEEPELSLHEEIISKLPNLFLQAINRKKTIRQLFVTTHSFALLHDQGILADEIVLIEPDKKGVTVRKANHEEKRLIEDGKLTAAEVFSPMTRPQNINQLTLF